MSEGERRKTQFIRLNPKNFMADMKHSDETHAHPLFPMLKGISDKVECVDKKVEGMESTVRDVKNCVLGNKEYKITGLVDRVDRHDILLDGFTKQMIKVTAYIGGGVAVIGFLLHVFKVL